MRLPYPVGGVGRLNNRSCPAIPTARKVWRPQQRPRAVRDRQYAKNAITFIFLGPMNDIDFLRRNGEWSHCWVVGDIEATIDLGGERLFAGAGGLVNARPASWRSTS